MQAEYEGLTFERPGHASVRIETDDGVVIYIDPWSEVIEGRPGDADYVFVTHDDRDHYDPDGIRAVWTDDTAVAAYEAIDTGDLGRDVVSLPADGEATVGDVGVETVPAYNRADGPHVRENGEPYHREGEVIGLVLAIDGVRVYFASDTDFLDDHRDVVADVLIPPIGGRPTMDRHEAAAMAAAIGPALVLPVHYTTGEGGAIEGLDADAEAFADEVEAGGARVVLF